MTDYTEVYTAMGSMKFGLIDYIPKLVPLLRSIQKERQAGHSGIPVFSCDDSAFQAIMKRIRLTALSKISV